MTNATNAAAAAAPVRNRDISSTELISTQAKVFRSGGTIFDLMVKLDDGWNSYTEEEKKKRIATINVRRSQAKAQYVGSRSAIRSELLKKLDEAGNDTSDTANAIRKEIREHDAKVASMLKTWKLSRRGRSGDIGGIDFGDLVENAIADAMLDDSGDDSGADSVEV